MTNLIRDIVLAEMQCHEVVYCMCSDISKFQIVKYKVMVAMCTSVFGVHA